MLLTNGIQQYVLDDVYARYSARLRGILNLEGQDIIDLGLVDGAVELDVDSDVLENFIRFLQGEANIRMNEDDEAFFSYMGIHNRYGYPLDYWAVKVRDNWIRDNMYKLNLFQDPYYGLVEVPVEVLDANVTLAIESEYLAPYLGRELYIAGGAALYMAGGIDVYKDVDTFFVTDVAQATNILAPIMARRNTNVTTNSIGFRLMHPTGDSVAIQFILRLYKAPTEIIHGFDLDCVGFLYGGDHKVYATERALYSMTHRVNWFDPERASPSYTNRLLKYHLRGYKIMLPSLDLNSINEEKVTDNIQTLMKIFLSIDSTYVIQENKPITALNTSYMIGLAHIIGLIENPTVSRLLEILIGSDYVVASEFNMLSPIERLTLLGAGRSGYNEVMIYEGVDKRGLILQGFKKILQFAGLDSHIDYKDVDKFPSIRDNIASWYVPGKYTDGQIVGYLSYVVATIMSRWGSYNPRRTYATYTIDDTPLVTKEPIFPDDDASRLILAYAYDIVVYNRNSPNHDYLGDDIVEDITRSVSELNRIEADKMALITFIEQDPMSQLTSTFHPEPTFNIELVYGRSPYYATIGVNKTLFPMSVVQ